MTVRTILGWVGCAIALGTMGCGADGTAPEGPTPAGLTAGGWAAFEAGALDSAEMHFTMALDIDPGFADALAGRGWVVIRRGDPGGASAWFDQALFEDSGLLDALAGRVLSNAGLDEPDGVLADGVLLLSRNTAYVFAHDPGYQASDIRWLVARAGVDTGDFMETVNQLDVLSPGHGLDPDAAAFAETALALLESLRDSV